MQKNVADQKWVVFAFSETDGTAVTGDAANITANLRIDGGAANAVDDTNPTELEDGYYIFDITAAESNGDSIVICPESSTADTQVVGVPGAVWTRPPNFEALGIESDGDLTKVNTLDGHTAQTGDSYAEVTNGSYGLDQLVRSTTPANTLDVSATGEVGLDFDNIKAATAPTTLTNITVPTVTTLTGHTAQTGDSYAVVTNGSYGLDQLVRSTTPANTLDVSATGEAGADVTYWNGSAVAVPTVAGVPEVDLTHMEGGTQSVTDLKDFADVGYDPITNKVQGVVLVDLATAVTTVTNLVNAPTAGSLTAAMEAQVNAEVDTALADYDGPTNAEMEARTIPSADYLVESDTLAAVTTVTNLTNAPTAGSLTAAMEAQVNAEVDTALADIHLDHLIAVAESDTPVNNSIIAKIASDDGDWSGFDPATDSLEAIRNRGDADWSSGAAANPNLLLESEIDVVNTQTEFTLVDGSDNDNSYNDQSIVLYENSNNDYPSVRVITDYVGATKTVTIDSAPDFTLAADDSIQIFVTAPGSTAPTAAQNADAVWDEAISGHTSAGTFGGQCGTDVDAILVDTSTTLPGLISSLSASSTSTILSSISTHDNKLDTVEDKVDVIDAKVDLVLEDTAATIPATLATLSTASALATHDGKLDTAQADLDIITGADGTTLATSQPNASFAQPGDAMTLENDAITSAKFDESTAFPITSADSGSTQIARTGADGDTLETLSDQMDTVDTAVDAILEDTGTTIPALIAALENISTSEVNAEMVDVLTVDTMSEMSQGAPPVSPTIQQVLNYLYRQWRNKTETTSSEVAVYDDAGTTKIVKAVLSDDGTTFTKAEHGTGA